MRRISQEQFIALRVDDEFHLEDCSLKEIHQACADACADGWKNLHVGTFTVDAPNLEPSEVLHFITAERPMVTQPTLVYSLVGIWTATQVAGQFIQSVVPDDEIFWKRARQVFAATKTAYMHELMDSVSPYFWALGVGGIFIALKIFGDTLWAIFAFPVFFGLSWILTDIALIPILWKRDRVAKAIDEAVIESRLGVAAK